MCLLCIYHVVLFLHRPCTHKLLCMTMCAFHLILNLCSHCHKTEEIILNTQVNTHHFHFVLHIYTGTRWFSSWLLTNMSPHLLGWRVVCPRVQSLVLFCSPCTCLCFCLLTTLSCSFVSQLQLVQNAADRLLTNRQLRSHITPMLANLHC